MLAVSTLNTNSSLISKALSDNSETFTRLKEDLGIKCKTSLEKTSNIETEASVLFNRNASTTAT